MGGVGDPEWRTNIERGGRIFRSRFTLSSVSSCHADHPAQAFLVRSNCHRSSGDKDTPGEYPARPEGVAESSNEVLVHKAGGPYCELVEILNSARGSFRPRSDVLFVFAIYTVTQEFGGWRVLPWVLSHRTYRSVGECLRMPN